MTARKRIHLIAGARPNFMKIAPLWHCLSAQEWCTPSIIHSGQHSDINMSDWFFHDLELPAPHYNLNAKTGSHAKVTGSVMMAYEDLIDETKPDLTVVVGDVDSTVACTLSAKKKSVPVAHLEAGLRSFDRTMPEELNRLLVDSIADLLWTPSIDGDENLLREGVDPERIQRVGNIMIDSLVTLTPKIDRVDLEDRFNVSADTPYVMVTLHRPANVDDPEQLEKIVNNLLTLTQDIQLVFPIHPRTRKRLEDFSLMDRISRSPIKILNPLGYIDFNALVKKSAFLITDSGGVQEETTFMGVPCLTLRPNTERPITITQGTNKLVDADTVLLEAQKLLARPSRASKAPVIDLWDGQTAHRTERALRAFLGN